MLVTFIIPIKTVSEANTREFWAAKAERVKSHRAAAFLLMRNKKRGLVVGDGMVITLTRIAPRKLDTDNNSSSMKACRDGIAEALGFDDGDERVKWAYAQRRGKPKEYAVEVSVDDGLAAPVVLP